MYYRINPDLSFTIFNAQHEGIFTSRAFRLRDQAVDQALMWLARANQTLPSDKEGITLVVDDFSVDPDSLLGGK